MIEKLRTISADRRKGERANEGREILRMARRRYQKGCLFKRGKNWVLRYREDVRNSNGSIGRAHRAVVLGSFASKKEAHQAADAYLSQFNNGSRLPQTILTFEEFWTKHFQLEILTKRKFSTQQV